MSSWQTRHRVAILVITLGVVIGGAISVFVRTGDTELGSVLVLAVVTLPSVISVLVTMKWKLWLAQCMLSVAAWATFLGPGGDLSCVDCAFALLIPIYIAVAQGILLLLGFLLPDLRRRDPAAE